MDSQTIKSVHLLEELIEEILSRLPVKSLLRFRCVSKSWLSLINNERFIEAHRQNSTKNGVIFECEKGLYKQCYVQQLLNEASSIKSSLIHHPMNDQFLRIAYFVGCCNGLLCLFTYQRSLCLSLWNPTTMIFMELPNLNGLGFGKFGFGWDGTSGTYKVFALSLSRHGTYKGNVYSSKTNSWKTVDHGCLPVYDREGVFACGKIHWVIKREDYDYIESFDLGSEEFGRIELPFPFTYTNKEEFHYTLAEIGGCLHLLRLHNHNRQLYAVVWVMKESGWLKLFAHRLVFERKLNWLQHPIIGGGPNGEILIMFCNNYLVYCPKQDVVREGKNGFIFYKGHVYVESLVSPNFTTS